MRILFFLSNVSKLRHFDGVVQMLAERGHTVVLASARQSRPLALPKNLALANRSLAARSLPGRVEIITCPVRRVDSWQRVAPALRQARDYLRFLDPRYAHAAKLQSRSATHAPRGWLRFIRDHPWLARHWRLVARALALAEDAMPSERLFDLFIAYERPDIVLVTPLVDYGSYQTDYVKSAHRVGVPVVFVPFSWDNLTNRGLIRVEPDRVLVWNEIQKTEATDLHGVSAERVIVVGAPRFDAFFAMRPSTTREAFCARIGLDPTAPFLLYLCSSEFVAPREVEFVTRWMSYLRQSSDTNVRTSGVLVRPHPAHLKQWKDVDLSGFPNTALWDEKVTMNADQSLYDSLHHSSAVVGLNTSAMIEAGILDKGVFTLVMEEFTGGQEGTLHFHYLRAANGGLLHEARGFDEHVRQLGAALRVGTGSDDAGDQVRRFVETFVRPRGIQAPVTAIVVEEIERAARISKRPRGAALWHYAARGGLRAAFMLRGGKASKGEKPEESEESAAMIATLTRRFSRRFSRRALPQPNATYYLWRYVGNGMRTCRAAMAPTSFADVSTIARELARQGIVVGPSDAFLTEDGGGALREAATRILERSRSAEVEAVVTDAASAHERQKEFLVHLVSYPDGIPADDPLLKVALDRKLLEIVSSYLGLWPCLHSVGAWLNYPTDAPAQISQLWHRDPEDLRLIKVFIYLADVDEGLGPFTYIPKTHPFGEDAVGAQKLEKKKRVPDDRMNRVFPPESWRVCTGPAGTMILADTVGYHRGGKPTAGRRILVTFTYTSGTPITDRPLHVSGQPAWTAAAIQRQAVRPLLRKPRPPVAGKKKKPRR